MIEDIDELSGAARTHPVMAFCLAMMMFSLAGVPPLAGFFAKFYVFARGDRGAARGARRHRRRDERRRRLLLRAHRQGHVFRRAARRLRADDACAESRARPRERRRSSCSGSCRPRSSARRRRPPARCSERMRFRLAPGAEAAGYRISELRQPRLDERRGVGARPGRGAGPTLGRVASTRPPDAAGAAGAGRRRRGTSPRASS